jgi:biotin transport system substrate-specific component
LAGAAPRRSALLNAALVVGGSLALWASAKLQVPFYPVPMTFQSLVVLAIGMAFGWRLGAATVALYLVEGAVGLPVFAGTPERGIGLAYMIGPTGGYLLGYLLAATLVGWLSDRGWGRSVWSAGAAMLLGTAAIYLPGLLWLGSVVGWDKPVLALGLLPFLLGDALKIAIGSLGAPAVLRLAGLR